MGKEEALNLAGAVKNVVDQYPVNISDKGAAWLALGMVTLTTFGPRVYLIRERLKQEAARNVTPPDNPTGFNTAPPPPGAPAKEEEKKSGGFTLPPGTAIM